MMHHSYVAAGCNIWKKGLYLAVMLRTKVNILTMSHTTSSRSGGKILSLPFHLEEYG